MAENIYQCPECGMHYHDQNIAKQCEAFCKAHKACSYEISLNSIEHQELMAKRGQQS